MIITQIISFPRAKLIALELLKYDDGTGDLGIIIQLALEENPDVSVEEIEDIILKAREEHLLKRGLEWL